jgi:hypothetical protein
VAADNEGVDQVSRPMQIALVAVVLLAGMWFTVLKPKPAADPAVPAAQPTAPGAAGLGRAVNAAKGAAAASDAANANIQKATGGSAATAAATAKPSASKAVATKTTKSVKAAAPAKKAAAKPAAAKKAATPVDPSNVLLRFLAKGKTVVLLFHGDGADDKAARQAVHRVARADKNVVSAYAPVSKVAAYRAITTDVEVTTAPTILVISSKKKAVALTGFVDYGVVRQTVGDVRAAAGQKR